MKKVKLCGKVSGFYALVDDCDFEFINSFRWNLIPKGYAIRTDRSSGIKLTIYMHRVIAERMDIDCSNQIDHIDGDKLDNRRCNLRSATNQQNQANVSVPINNSTGYKGVTERIKNGRHYFVARIGVGYRRFHLGCFSTAEDASEAYKSAASKYFGEFAQS